MAQPLLPDDLWELIAPLLPPPKPRRRRFPGRKPVGDREALTGILLVLKAGLPWEMLPQEMGCGCGMTCWRRLRDWKGDGTWEKIHKALLGQLRAAGKLDTVGFGKNRPAVDGHDEAAWASNRRVEFNRK